MADHPAHAADVGERAQPVANLLAAAADRCDRGDVRQRREHLLDLLVDRGRDERERLGAGLLGREVRVDGIGGESVVELRRDLTEPAGVRREPPRIRRERVERELPPVSLGRDELLQDRERRLERPSLVGDVALERGDVLEPSLGEEAEDLELRVHPRLDPAVELERQPLVDHERAVRLLRTHRPDLGALAETVAEVAGAAEEERCFADVERRVVGDQVDDPPDEVGIRDRVVDRPPLCRSDDRGLPVVRLGPEAERQVVQIVALKPVAHLDDREGEERRLAWNDARVEDTRIQHVPRLAAEPALRGDRPEQDEPVEEVQVALLDAVPEVSVHRPDPGVGTRRSRAGRA